VGSKREANIELGLSNESFAFGLLEESEAHYLRSLSLHETAGAHYNLGILFHTLGNMTKAIESFQRALALDTKYQPARDNLWLCLESIT